MKGVARLRHCALKPLYLDGQVDREVRVHGHFVSESLALFLFYFLQLGVLATYVSQDLVKLVPLLTIVFVFGRYVKMASREGLLSGCSGSDGSVTNPFKLLTEKRFCKIPESITGIPPVFGP